MIDVTFMLSPLMKLNSFPIVTRVITSNMNADKNINAHYNTSILETNKKFHDTIHEVKLDIPDYAKNYLYRKDQYLCNNIILNDSETRQEIIDSVETEIVLFSSFSVDGLTIVKDLLNAGKKIVLGGAFCFIYEPAKLREVLIDIGTEKSKMDNIIIVKGYVDLETNISDIINNWKDVVIKENKLWTLYDCNEDFLLEHLDYLRSIKKFNFDTRLNISFKQKCNYLKCRYCNHKLMPDVVFIKDSNTTINYVNKLVEDYGTNKIFITDSYLSFDEDELQILEGIKQHKLGCFSGILALNKDIKIIDYINKYVDEVYIGLESTIDFALDYVRKGYHYSDELKCIDNIIKYMNKDKTIYFNVIMDLPMRNKEDVFLNFKRLGEIKERFTTTGFSNFQLNPWALMIEPSIKMIDNKYLRLTKTPTSGDNFILNNLENYNFLPGIDMNFSRFDSDGNFLPSDFELIDTKFLYNQYFK